MTTQTMGKPKPVRVKVCIKDDPTKYPPEAPYDFWLETDDSSVGKKKGNALTFKNDQDDQNYDGFDIVFELDNKADKKLKFMDIGTTPDGKPDPNCAPMWVKTVSDFDEPCPDHQFWDQFWAVEVTANNTKLRVRNENKCKQKFKFAFLFSRNPSKGPCEVMYDPDGTNQNGPKTLRRQER